MRSFFLSHMGVHETLSECWLTLCEYTGHVDAPEWSNGCEVSVTSCGRVKMALQRLGEHSSSVVWHINGSHTRVWAKHTHTHSLKIGNFLQPQDVFFPMTPKHTMVKDVGLEWGRLSKRPSSTLIVPLIIVIGTDPLGRPRAWISCPDWLTAWSRTARGWLWEAERCSTPLLHPPTRGSYALCPDTHTRI